MTDETPVESTEQPIPEPEAQESAGTESTESSEQSEAPVAEEVPTPKTFTQDEVQEIATRERNIGRRQASKELQSSMYEVPQTFYDPTTNAPIPADDPRAQMLREQAELNRLAAYNAQIAQQQAQVQAYQNKCRQEVSNLHSNHPDVFNFLQNEFDTANAQNAMACYEAAMDYKDGLARFGRALKERPELVKEFVGLSPVRQIAKVGAILERDEKKQEPIVRSNGTPEVSTRTGPSKQTAEDHSGLSLTDKARLLG